MKLFSKRTSSREVSQLAIFYIRGDNNTDVLAGASTCTTWYGKELHSQQTLEISDSALFVLPGNDSDLLDVTSEFEPSS
jgi:aconitase B